MARTFPAALALAVAVTGTSLPAAAAPSYPAASAPAAVGVAGTALAATLETTRTAGPSTPTASARPGVMPEPEAGAPGTTWSEPLAGVSRTAAASAPALSHAHGLGLGGEASQGAPRGELAALSDATATGEFTLAAVSWGPDPVHEVTSIALRVREGGEWSDWFEVGAMVSDDADARLGSEPVIAPGADGVQARVETTTGRTPKGLRIDLVRDEVRSSDRTLSSAVSPTAAQNGDLPPGNDDVPDNGTEPPAPEPEPEPAPEPRPKPGPPRDAAATGDEIRPEIVTRADWGADESVVREASRSTRLKAVYVHHTAGSNTYTKAQSPGVVRSILRYHAVTLGWPDVGYQFLVDRFGTIYEGRRGSLDELVVGAQAGGYNTDTIGVSAMGDFHPRSNDSKKVKKQRQPPDAMLQSIIDVITWQTFRWNMKPKSKVRLRTGGSTGSGTRWRVGELTDQLPRIRGHRATNYTACPGDNLDGQLKLIRNEVAYHRKMALAEHGTPPTPPARPAAVPLKPKQAPVRLPKRTVFRWHPSPGAVGYEVLVRRAKHGKVAKPVGSGWRVHKTTTKTKRKLKIPKGATWQVAVRAVNAHGLRSGTTVLGTTTRPVGSKKLVRSKTQGAKWKKVKKKGYYRKRAFTTRKRGATITVRGGTGIRRVAIIAPSGPQYGRARLSVGGATIGTVDFSQPKYGAKRQIHVNLPRVMSGKVQLTTLDKKLVRVSAIALARS